MGNDKRNSRVRMEGAEEIDIVIVGGGICGLATALALHRKGIPSVVLERSECLRAIGGGITMRNNGWIALDQLGVASKLRQTSLLIQGAQDIWLHSGKQREFGYGESETRCLKRSKLIGTLAESLPLGTLRFGCHVVSIQLDPLTSYAIVQLNNGSTITSKMLIGCDGANSVVAYFLGLKPAKPSSIWEVRGFTNYPNGHTFGNQFVQVHGDCDIMGRIPIHHKLVYWFVTQKRGFQGSKASKDPKEIKNMTLESIKDFPRDIVDMIHISDLESLSEVRIRYRSPWDIILQNYRKGMVTVGGDAMHVMGPFIGQGVQLVLKMLLFLLDAWKES